LNHLVVDDFDIYWPQPIIGFHGNTVAFADEQWQTICAPRDSGASNLHFVDVKPGVAEGAFHVAERGDVNPGLAK
jgi:hypothetical protein